MTATGTTTETVEEFASRARAWLAENLPRRDPGKGWGFGSDEEELAAVEHMRRTQRKLYDGGFAGICFPAEYGGRGLPYEYQQAFNRECRDYDMPAMLNVPTFVPCAAVLLEFGTEDQKRRHLPAILRGEQIWMQLLSEPGGGSDVAGATTSAVRDGDEWIINGSKVWTSGAWWADYGLCLARTNWDVPKHQGLSVFIIEFDQPGIEIQRIEMLNGSREFCQEFMTDLRVSDGDRVGDVDDGWTIGRRWMFHERSAMGGGSPYTSGPGPGHSGRGRDEDALVRLALDTGQIEDDRVLDLLGEIRVLQRGTAALSSRIQRGMVAGTHNDAAGAIARLGAALLNERTTDVQLELAGPVAAGWSADDLAGRAGLDYLMRQGGSIGGGTTEMARNNISERVLGMPRERALDKDVPFREVPKGPTSGT